MYAMMLRDGPQPVALGEELQSPVKWVKCKHYGLFCSPLDVTSISHSKCAGRKGGHWKGTFCPVPVDGPLIPAVYGVGTQNTHRILGYKVVASTVFNFVELICKT